MKIKLKYIIIILLLFVPILSYSKEYYKITFQNGKIDYCSVITKYDCGATISDCGSGDSYECTNNYKVEGKYVDKTGTIVGIGMVFVWVCILIAFLFAFHSL